MSKHILFNALNIMSARYDSDIHGDAIPADALEVSDELFYQTINEQDGIWTLVKGKIVKKPLPPPVPYIPSIVSMRQVRLALLNAGLLATVSGAIAAGDEAGQIEWEYATQVDKNSQLVASMKAALNLSDAEIDELFKLAATL